MQQATHPPLIIIVLPIIEQLQKQYNLAQPMQEKRQVEKFFQSQNIMIRKNIREIDMGYDSYNTSSINVPITKKTDVNVLVVGPSRSGKTTLLRTMHYALNGNLSCYLENRNISDTCYDRFEIKKNKRVAVEGLSKVKETDEKLGVYGYEINFGVMGGSYKNPMDKYARAVELINTRSLGCISHNMSGSGLGGINYIIICLNMVEKLTKQEVIALRFFITEVEQKKIKFNIVGTHLDMILGRQSKNLSSSFTSNGQQQKMIYVEDWKKFIQAELCPKIYADIYCMENYPNICKKQGFENSEVVNYYSLTLLDKCIKKAPETQKSKKVSLKLFCF